MESEALNSPHFEELERVPVMGNICFALFRVIKKILRIFCFLIKKILQKHKEVLNFTVSRKFYLLAVQIR